MSQTLSRFQVSDNQNEAKAIRRTRKLCFENKTTSASPVPLLFLPEGKYYIISGNIKEFFSWQTKNPLPALLEIQPVISSGIAIKICNARPPYHSAFATKRIIVVHQK